MMRKVIIRVCIVAFILVSLFILVGCEKRDDLFINGVQYAYDDYSDTYKVREITFWAGWKVIIRSEINGKPVTTLDGESQWMKLPAVARIVIIPETVTRVEWNFVRYCRKLVYNEDSDGYYLGSKDNPYFLFVRPKEDEVAEQYNYVSNIEIEPAIKETPVTPPYNSSDSGVVSCRINENCKLLIDGAFANSENLRSITIPGNIKTISSYAFAECENLETIILEEGVEKIAREAFKSCVNLKYIDFPSSIREIGDCAFCSCYAIESFEIPEGVITLGTAFEWCYNLKEIFIPSTVTNMDCISYECLALEKIEVSENNPYYKSIDGIVYSKDGTVLIRYPAAKQDETFKIPDGVKKICSNAFFDNYYVKNIVIPKSVVEIENYFRSYSVENVYYCGNTEAWKKINYNTSVDFYHATVFLNCDYEDYE